MNPYEQGRADYAAGKRSSNPFLVFSEKWALYNRGYNSGWMK